MMNDSVVNYNDSVEKYFMILLVTKLWSKKILQFRKLTRILVHGKVLLCKEVFKVVIIIIVIILIIIIIIIIMVMKMAIDLTS